MTLPVEESKESIDPFLLTYMYEATFTHETSETRSVYCEDTISTIVLPEENK